MADVIQLGKVRKARATKKEAPITMDTFTQALERDIENLSKATGKTPEEAIQMASDFYRKYPMLVEHVRSPEFMLSRK